MIYYFDYQRLTSLFLLLLLSVCLFYFLAIFNTGKTSWQCVVVLDCGRAGRKRSTHLIQQQRVINYLLDYRLVVTVTALYRAAGCGRPINISDSLIPSIPIVDLSSLAYSSSRL